MSPSPPPDSVLAAFGVDSVPRSLPGGQGTSWAADDVVLKPESGPVHEWFAGVAVEIVERGFRLAAPVRSRVGSWSVEGWSATKWVAGHPPDLSLPQSWTTVLAAGRAFHRATSRLPRPAAFSVREDWWAIADRAAWGEVTIEVPPQFDRIALRLAPLLLPLGDSQVVHGDLTLNVLVEPGLDPAIIDVSPYWRPAAYAEGIVVADAWCWHDADEALLKQCDVLPAAVARALLFRMYTTAQQVDAIPPDRVRDELRRYEHAAKLLGV